MNFAKVLSLGLAVASLLLLPVTLTGQVVVESSDMNLDNDANTATNTISGFTVAAGDNRKLVVAVNSETAGLVDSIEYGTGEFFTLAVDNGSTRLSQIWYLDNPSVGTADIVISFSANARSRAGVVSLQNAAPGPPVVTNSEGASATSIDLTTIQANTFVIGCYNQNNGAGNPTGPGAFTNLYNGDSGSSNSDAGYVNEAVAGMMTYAWTTTSNGGIAIAGFGAFDPLLAHVVNSDWNRDGDSGTNTNTIPNFVVPPGDDRKLVVSINGEWSGTNSVSIAYGVQNLTLAKQNAPNGRTAQVWYLDDPAVGTADLVATLAENTRSVMGAVSLVNAAAGGPVASNSVGAGATSIDLDVPPNTFVIGSYVQNGDGNTVVDPFSSTLYHADSGSSWGISGYQNELAGGLQSYSYTGSPGAGMAVAGFGATALDLTLVHVRGKASNFDGDGGTNTNTISSFTVVSDSDLKLVLAASWENGDTSISATWNGSESFFVAENSAGGRNSAILYLDDPTPGTGDIVVTFGANTGSQVGVVALSNAADGFAVTSTQPGLSGDLTTPQDNTLVVGVYTSNGNIGVAGTFSSPFASSLYAGNSSSSHGIAGCQNEASAGMQTYAWTDDNTSSANNALAGFVAAGGTPMPTTPAITAFSFDPSGATSSTLSFTGDLSADYVVTSSMILSDDFPTTVTPTAATVGSLLGNVITTDGFGDASIEFTETGTVNFVRVETAP